MTSDLALAIRMASLVFIAVVGGLIGAAISTFYPGDTIFSPLSAALLGALVIFAFRRLLVSSNPFSKVRLEY